MKFLAFLGLAALIHCASAAGSDPPRRGRHGMDADKHKSQVDRIKAENEAAAALRRADARIHEDARNDFEDNSVSEHSVRLPVDASSSESESSQIDGEDDAKNNSEEGLESRSGDGKEILPLREDDGALDGDDDAAPRDNNHDAAAPRGGAHEAAAPLDAADDDAKCNFNERNFEFWVYTKDGKFGFKTTYLDCCGRRQITKDQHPSIITNEVWSRDFALSREDETLKCGRMGCDAPFDAYFQESCTSTFHGKSMSNFLYNLVCGDEERIRNEGIPIPRASIEGPILGLVFEFINKIHPAAEEAFMPQDIDKPISGIRMDQVLKNSAGWLKLREKEIKFIEHRTRDPAILSALFDGEEFDDDENSVKTKNAQKWCIFYLILAANYLHCKPLLDLCCAYIATLIKGKGPEEIKRILGGEPPRGVFYNPNVENELTEIMRDNGYIHDRRRLSSNERPSLSSDDRQTLSQIFGVPF